MTDDEIRQMYRSLADDDEWEYKPMILPESAWCPFKLGMPIDDEHKYRKCWYVVQGCSEKVIANRTDNGHYLYKSESYDDCYQWLEENRQTWMEKQISGFSDSHASIELTVEAVINETVIEIRKRAEKTAVCNLDNERFIKLSDLNRITAAMGINA